MKHARRLFSGVMAMALCVSLTSPALATHYTGKEETPFPILYQGKDHDMVKVSHPTIPQSQRKVGNKHPDGLVDYLGNGLVGIPGVDKDADNQGARGQCYAWAAYGYGDYVYINTCYNAAMATAQLFPDNDPESAALRDKFTNILYRGDMFYGEEDGANAGCVLVKYNVKTGEMKRIMDHTMVEDSYGNDYGGFYKGSYARNKNGMNPQFRNAVELNGKLYFCGAPAAIPSVWEIDPETDQFRRVYADPALVKNPALIGKAVSEDGLCVAIRGMTVMDGHLIISCVGPDINPYILVSKTDDIQKDGFTKIASTWDEESWAKDQQKHGWPTETTKKGELFGYPACHIKDAVFGGSIFEMIPYNGDLYVSICTGSLGNVDEGGTYAGNSTAETLQSFAVVRGHYEGDITDRDAWTWEPIIGDRADGAKYDFGIDPARTRAAAATLMVVGDHLYIGEYNDTEIATTQMLDGMNMKFMADNLEQGVNLYRLDKQDHIDMIAGNKTDMFPNGSVSGLKSGFGEKKTDHGNQYVWRMEEFQDKLCIGTFDESDILHPFGQLSNGDLIRMDAKEWADQMHHVWNFIKYIIGQKVNPSVLDMTPEMESVVTEVEALTPEQLALLTELAEAGDEVAEMLDEQSVNALSMPNFLSADNKFTSAAELYQAMLLVPQLLEQDDSWTLEQKIQSKNEFIELYTHMTEGYQATRIKLPAFIQNIFDQLLQDETVAKLNHVARCLYYLKDCTEGFDFYIWDDEAEKMEVVTRDGMGDPYNQGLRVFAKNESKANPWLCIGTANTFYGTQLWRLEGLEPELQFPFIDVTENDWFYDAVRFTWERGLFTGITPNLFGPHINMTRAMLVQTLYSMAGKPETDDVKLDFTDVPADIWYADAVRWAVKNGIVAGYDNGKFGPDDLVNREQMAAILHAMGGKEEVQQELTFSDVDEISDWAMNGIRWAVKNGIMVGVGNNRMAPKANATRAESAVMLMQYLKLTEQ